MTRSTLELSSIGASMVISVACGRARRAAGCDVYGLQRLHGDGREAVPPMHGTVAAAGRSAPTHKPQHQLGGRDQPGSNDVSMGMTIDRSVRRRNVEAPSERKCTCFFGVAT